jgi:hypothetical protein
MMNTVKESGFDYSGLLLSMRELGIARQKICGGNYTPASYDVFVLSKGAKLIDKRNKRQSKDSSGIRGVHGMKRTRESER